MEKIEDLKNIELINEDRLIDKIPEEAPSDDLMPLDEKRIALAQYVAMGFKITDIAHRLGVSEAWVREHKKDKEVRVFVSELQREAVESARMAINYGAIKAIETINELMGPEVQPSVRLAAAKDFLDRVPELKVAGKEGGVIIHNNINVAQMSKEELRESLRRRIEILESDE